MCIFSIFYVFVYVLLERPSRAHAREASRAVVRRTIRSSNTRSKTRKMNKHPSSACRAPPANPASRPVVPRSGSPVHVVLPTVPSQIPLRALVSHSERFLAPCQYETLEWPLEAVYGPYSTSAPRAAHSTMVRQVTRHDTDAE